MSTRTESRPAPATSDPESPRPRINLSLTQVLASALAAITATVGASYLGVAGTVIGAAVASVLTVVGNAVYGHSLQRTGERVRTVVPLPARATRPVPSAPVRTNRPRRRGWPITAAACVGVFAGVLLVVTSVELIAGRPLSDLLRGQQGTGTSVLGDVGRRSAATTAPTAPATVTVTPTVVTATPTVTVTGAPVTRTATPTATTTPASPTPSGSTSAGSSAAGSASTAPATAVSSP